ncbi:MAG: hypothetical protein AAF297_00760 [Planctomycetota bacterium]
MLELAIKGREAVLNGDIEYVTPSAADFKAIDQWLKERGSNVRAERTGDDLEDIIKQVMERSGHDGTMPALDDGSDPTSAGQGERL